LTTYLGDLLSVRSGAVPAEEFPDMLAAMASSLASQPGRQWRALEDTAAVSYQLRGRSKAWHGSRRGQDYYNEGLLLWLEIDGKLRSGSDGRVSLDDFCRAFFKKQGPPPFQEFELQTVLDLLASLGHGDWLGLVDRRVQEPMEELSLEFAEVLGWRLAYGTKPSAHVEAAEEERKQIGAVESVGLLLGEDGGIVDLAPGSVADRAGLGPGMKVLGVNSRKFSKARLLEGLAASPQRRGIELLVMDGDWLRTVNLDYAGGPRHHRLERDPSKRDWLKEILAPIAGGK
jgi:predicted metalloprotease with PDZ domain